MAQSTNTTANATANNEVVNPQSATATSPKGGNTPTRVVETRDMWAVVFDHTATLLAKVCNGEAVEGKDDLEGFAFGKATDKEGKTRRVSAKEQPNIRPYFHSLLAGFASKKGIKHSKGTALETLNLEEVAEKVFLGLYPKGDFAQKVGKAEPKQAKSLIAAVIAKL